MTTLVPARCPADHQPHPTALARAWRIAGMLVVSTVGLAGAIGRERDTGLWLVGVDLCLGATSFLVVSWRRRWPVAVASGLGLTAIVSISSSGPGLLAVASLATRRRVREIGPVAAVTIVCWVLFELITANPAPLWQVLASTIVVIAGAVGLGGYVGFRRERAAHEKSANVAHRLPNRPDANRWATFAGT